MRLKRNDAWATALVTSAVALYTLWWTGTAFESLSTRIVGAAALALGFAACTSDRSELADVFGVGDRHRVPTAYAVVASLLGAVAFIAGVITLVSASETMLTVLVAAMVALWAMSTIRHAVAPSGRALDRSERLAREALPKAA